MALHQNSANSWWEPCHIASSTCFQHHNRISCLAVCLHHSFFAGSFALRRSLSHDSWCSGSSQLFLWKNNRQDQQRVWIIPNNLLQLFVVTRPICKRCPKMSGRVEQHFFFHLRIAKTQLASSQLRCWQLSE